MKAGMWVAWLVFQVSCGEWARLSGGQIHISFPGGVVTEGFPSSPGGRLTFS